MIKTAVLIISWICLFSFKSTDSHAFARIQIHGKLTEIPICPGYPAPSSYKRFITMSAVLDKVKRERSLHTQYLLEKFLKLKSTAPGGLYWLMPISPEVIFSDFVDVMIKENYDFEDEKGIHHVSYGRYHFEQEKKNILHSSLDEDNWISDKTVPPFATSGIGESIDFGSGVILENLAYSPRLCSILETDTNPQDETLKYKYKFKNLDRGWNFYIPFGSRERTLVTIPGLITQPMGGKVEANMRINLSWEPYPTRGYLPNGKSITSDTVRLYLEKRDDSGNWTRIATDTLHRNAHQSYDAIHTESVHSFHVEAEVPEFTVVRARLVVQLEEYGDLNVEHWGLTPRLTSASLFGSTCFPDFSKQPAQCLP